MAGTLANGGTCPTTGDKVFEPQHVKNCLSLMLSCGMYDYSGEWAFRTGSAAKSGVGGSVFVVVPNRMGICIWSPRLDRNGNSVRGVEFTQALQLPQVREPSWCRRYFGRTKAGPLNKAKLEL